VAGMRVVSLKVPREFWEEHADAEVPLRAWYKVAEDADWTSIQDVRQVYAHADAVTLDSGLCVTVVNIGGNKYRLIARIIYEHHLVYVKRVLTHAAYTKGRWKEQL
jgi:mRNA interferase HigB